MGEYLIADPIEVADAGAQDFAAIDQDADGRSHDPVALAMAARTNERAVGLIGPLMANSAKRASAIFRASSMSGAAAMRRALEAALSRLRFTPVNLIGFSVLSTKNQSPTDVFLLRS